MTLCVTLLSSTATASTSLHGSLTYLPGARPSPATQSWRRNSARPTRNDSVSSSASVSVPNDRHLDRGQHAAQRRSRGTQQRAFHTPRLARHFDPRHGGARRSCTYVIEPYGDLRRAYLQRGARRRTRAILPSARVLCSADGWGGGRPSEQQRQQVRNNESSSTVALRLRGGDEGLEQATTAWPATTTAPAPSHFAFVAATRGWTAWPATTTASSTVAFRLRGSDEGLERTTTAPAPSHFALVAATSDCSEHGALPPPPSARK